MEPSFTSRGGVPSRGRPQAVIFDLDGTLVDTVPVRIEAWLRVFAEFEIPTHRDAVAVLIGSDGAWLARHVAASAGMEMTDERAEAIDVRAGEIYSELNTDPRPLPGARRLSAALDRAGVRSAIATSSRRAQVGRSVAALHLSRAPEIVDGSHVAHAKPAPDLLEEAARRLAVDPAETWYVGDSTFDMQAAIAAGMHPIGVTTGAVDAATLRGAGAAEVVGSLDELADRLEGPAD